MGHGESTTVVAVYALVLHLRILRIFAIIVFFPEGGHFLNEPNLLFFHINDMHLATGCFVLTTYSLLDVALGPRARTVSFRYH